jgi:cytochrome c oxidase subunit 3
MADAHAKNHDYHLVNPSPWPVVGAASAFILAIGAVNWMHGGNWLIMALGFALVFYTMFMWWRDVIHEAHAGDHTPVVSLHLRYGMIMFIASEVMFFVAWFWAFFDASLFSDETIQASRVALTGGTWPPTGTKIFDPWHLPLVNTLILLTSGTTVTWAHHALLNNNRQGLKWGLIATVALGTLFTSVQAYEYAHAQFAFSREGEGNIYGSTFFMATGFHGFHVLVGTIFLLVCLFRAMKGHFTPQQHFGFEAAAWYWHFVDVVWLFLFSCVYVWASAGVVIGHE